MGVQAKGKPTYYWVLGGEENSKDRNGGSLGQLESGEVEKEIRSNIFQTLNGRELGTQKPRRNRGVRPD